MQTSTTTLMLILSTFIPVFGIILAATPYLTPTSECFAVTIPTAQSHDHTLATYRRLYCGIMVACTAAMTAACVAAACLDPTHAFLACFIVGMLALIILGYILMLVFRAKVQHIKQERGWQAQRQRSAAIIGPDCHVPHPISMRWNLLYVPVFAVTLAIGYAGYQRMPEHIPLQVNLNSETTRTMARSLMAIWLPLLVFGLLAAVLIFTQYVITHSKKDVDANDPESSAYAYGLYARAWSVFTLVAGLIVCMLAPIMELSFTGAVSPRQAMIIVFGVLILVIGGSATLSIALGQNGSKVRITQRGDMDMPSDDDAHWKLDVFYANHDDASVFVPKRFGIEWTVNIARPATWALLVVAAALTIGVVVAVTMLA
ncbi:hypothetical protein CQR46_0628 [Bifidobacterium pseudolongum subsp. globosum]|uniref:DUF5808 domain-containing protein n=1 Tax=Bifidobacterium pseudolongum subsp. globosum TaxID=1690 RepID=A0A2N3R4J0_9BIFI|nr:DUF5808 domain-containing protein [Bifidobacterium pseudolongum]PKU91541.1 hypothetical protein CQR46_0628 [Bifidobacterium pseudolongum subsp. globosum]PKV03531.1 hypothetical protein CQR50_1239 [Bifidobacterium pseudolongum subsp. globosum]